MAKDSKKKEVEEVQKQDAAAPASQVALDMDQLKKDAEEAALRRVCEATGVDYDEFINREKNKADDPEVWCELGPHPIHINSVPFFGRVRVKRSVAEVLLSAASARRQRILNEKIGNNYEVRMLAEGGFSARAIGTPVEEEA